MFVAMKEAAHFRDGQDFAMVLPRYWPGLRRTFVQYPMCAGHVAKSDVGFDDPSQVTLVPDDDVFNAFPPY